MSIHEDLRIPGAFPCGVSKFPKEGAECPFSCQPIAHILVLSPPL